MAYQDTSADARAPRLPAPGELPRALRTMPPQDIVARLKMQPPAEVSAWLVAAPAQARAELFAHFPPGLQDALHRLLPRGVAVELFERLPSDDRADLFNRLDADERQQLLQALADAEREDILRLAAYPEGTVGSITTSDYATLTASMTPAQALDRVRGCAPGKETVYTLYVLDDERRLVGMVPLRELVLAPASATVAELMVPEPVFARADWPREKASALIRDYDLLALPVLGGRGEMIGIVTVDDAMDVETAEATEDIFKGVAVQDHGPGALSGVSLRDASVLRLYRMRVLWLVVLVFGNIFSGAGIARFEDTISSYIALVFFLPLLIDSGGNAGSQAATLMVRSLATGDVSASDWLGLLGREFGIAALLGVTMAAAVWGIGLVRAGPDIAVVVAVAMVAIVIVGSVIGASLPFALSHFGIDPATASAPLVTSIADVSGVLIYLSLAVLILGGPGGN